MRSGSRPCAVLQLQMSLAPNDEHALELLMQINHSPRLALLLKNEPAWTTPPAGASWVGRFEEAVAPLATRIGRELPIV